jgi:tripartite-type tricarboxylate transporter receptor subunit TctC
MRAAKVTALIGLAAQLLLLGSSSAADYPSRPIKLLVGASARMMADVNIVTCPTRERRRR